MNSRRLVTSSIQVDDGGVDTIAWWPRLDPDARDWIVAHNGEAVDPDVLVRIEAAGGIVGSGAWWVGESTPDGFFFSDEAVDWIEAVANGE